MKRIKKHKMKTEKPESSTSYKPVEDYDLTYFIHDRVELMHQVFSVLKPKELKAIVPDCVRQLSIDNLQELCTEELLGISSKRLCAILDGVEAPSDTDTSSESPERLETISLDSISSDEEILSETSNKKHKKHKRHHRSSKSKPKPKQSDQPNPEATAPETDQSRASRAGLTVLELLELQARARAIRAQLQREQASKQQAEPQAEGRPSSGDDEVEIKEEPAEVVEISSEDEKPKLNELREKLSSNKETSQSANDTQTITKRVNDLVVTVPQAKQSRKIKLNRSKITVSVSNTENTVTTSKPVDISNANDKATTSKTKETSKEVKKTKVTKEKEQQKKKLKKKGKKKAADKDSDHDEITLQLSDTEKMDLLEDLDRKNYEKLSSSGSEDTESSSSDSESQSNSEDVKNESKDTSLEQSDLQKELDTITEIIDKNQIAPETSDNVDEEVNKKTNEPDNVTESVKKNSQEDLVPISSVIEIAPSSQEASTDNDVTQAAQIDDVEQSEVGKQQESLEVCVEITSIDDIPVIADEEQNTANVKPNSPTKDVAQTTENDKESEKEMSEGEVSDKASSEIEAVELRPEVVCISDEETDKKAKKKKKEKKKKSKSKKAKKSKSDFRESSDQNFYKDAVLNTAEGNSEVNRSETIDVDQSDNKIAKPDSVISVDVADDDSGIEKSENKTDDPTIPVDDEYDDVYEILELSDDSSCYEVEGTVLSKEPTSEEIEALSAKIDEIEREDVVTEEEIREHERHNIENKGESENVEDISWKDRYLDSKKVKRVLTTSSIFNLLRKKNRELKLKLEESKKQEVEKEIEEKVEEPAPVLEEGSIEHFNMLQGSNKYVNPVKEPVNTELEQGAVESEESTTNVNIDETAANSTENAPPETQTPQAVKEMRKDAKQLLKMYKKLLKYNDISKQKDPNKKKKKKTKKKNKEVKANSESK